MSSTNDISHKKQNSQRKANVDSVLTRAFGYKASLAAGVAAGIAVVVKDSDSEIIDKETSKIAADSTAAEKESYTLLEALELLKKESIPLLKGAAALVAVLSGGILLTNYAVKKAEEDNFKEQKKSLPPETAIDDSSNNPIPSLWNDKSPKVINWQEKVTHQTHNYQPNINL